MAHKNVLLLHLCTSAVNFMSEKQTFASLHPKLCLHTNCFVTTFLYAARKYLPVGPSSTFQNFPDLSREYYKLINQSLTIFVKNLRCFWNFLLILLKFFHNCPKTFPKFSWRGFHNFPWNSVMNLHKVHLRNEYSSKNQKHETNKNRVHWKEFCMAQYILT